MQEQETIHAVMAPLDDDSIKSRILTIRGVQVILDRDIAILYGVETKVLNQAVKRNRERFPDRFMFQLTEEELGNWKSQIVTSNPSLEQSIRMGVRRAPYAFTEQGVAMLSAVLRSETAIRVSIQIMDAFSAMRRSLASIAPILSRLDVVERRQITDQSRNEEREVERQDIVGEYIYLETVDVDQFGNGRNDKEDAQKHPHHQGGSAQRVPTVGPQSLTSSQVTGSHSRTSFPSTRRS